MVRTNLPCPGCDFGTVEVARFAWYQRGRFPTFLPRVGRRQLLGCVACVRRTARTELLWNALLGWWCLFPPSNIVILVQNILILGSRDRDERAALHKALDEIGIALDDHEFGEDGLTAPDRASAQRLVPLLVESMHADATTDAAELSRAGSERRLISDRREVHLRPYRSF